jgi:excinuclease ABC subunit B
MSPSARPSAGPNAPEGLRDDTVAHGATTAIVRRPGRFEVVSEYDPAGDQPAAIDELERRVKAGENDVVLLGATGTGAGDRAEQDARGAAGE